MKTDEVASLKQIILHKLSNLLQFKIPTSVPLYTTTVHFINLMTTLQVGRYNQKTKCHRKHTRYITNTASMTMLFYGENRHKAKILQTLFSKISDYKRFFIFIIYLICKHRIKTCTGLYTIWLYSVKLKHKLVPTLKEETSVHPLFQNTWLFQTNICMQTASGKFPI